MKSVGDLLGDQGGVSAGAVVDDEVHSGPVLYGLVDDFSRWSFRFFGLRSPLAGLVGIVALAVCIFMTLHLFLRISFPVGVLLIPYLLLKNNQVHGLKKRSPLFGKGRREEFSRMRFQKAN